MTKARFQHFPHDADVGIRGLGATEAEAFEQAALALTAIVADPALVRPLETVDVTCEAPDVELLFADWINAVIYEMARRNMLFSAFEVRIAGGTLAGRLRGEAVDPERHHPAVEPKGATYTELRVGPCPDGPVEARCVVDV